MSFGIKVGFAWWHPEILSQFQVLSKSVETLWGWIITVWPFDYSYRTARLIVPLNTS